MARARRLGSVKVDSQSMGYSLDGIIRSVIDLTDRDINSDFVEAQVRLLTVVCEMALGGRQFFRVIGQPERKENIAFAILQVADWLERKDENGESAKRIRYLRKLAESFTVDFTPSKSVKRSGVDGVCEYCKLPKLVRKRKNGKLACEGCNKKHLLPKHKCSGCQKKRPVHRWDEEGNPFCSACAYNPKVVRVGTCPMCLKEKPLAALDDEGNRICSWCHDSKVKPKEICLVCGNPEIVKARTIDEEAIGKNCYQTLRKHGEIE